MEDKGESKFRNVMERYWYALFIIAVALAGVLFVRHGKCRRDFCTIC